MKIADRVGRIQPSQTLAVAAKAAKLKAQGVDVIAFGVGKSGSPAPKSMTSTPCALSLMASAATFMVGDTPIRLVRSASICQALKVSRASFLSRNRFSTLSGTSPCTEPPSATTSFTRRELT